MTNGTSVEVFGKIDVLRTFLSEKRDSFEGILAPGVTPDRIIKLAIVAATKTPGLLSCSRLSLMQALMTSAELGLDFTGTLGHAYLIPYKGQATLMIGYRGLCELAMRSGKVADIEARLVYANEPHTFEMGLNPVLTHRPLPPSERGEIVSTYCVVSLTSGAKKVEWMWREEVDDIRDRSKAGRDGPWVTDYGEMARKTVTRRALKWVPLTPDIEYQIAKAVEGEDRALGLGEIPATVPLAGRHGGAGTMTLEVRGTPVEEDKAADADIAVSDDGTGL